MNKETALKTLQDAANKARLWAHRRDQAMVNARDAGATHEEIAHAIGRHRQQVQRWFKRRTDR